MLGLGLGLEGRPVFIKKSRYGPLWGAKGGFPLRSTCRFATQFVTNVTKCIIMSSLSMKAVFNSC